MSNTILYFKDNRIIMKDEFTLVLHNFMTFKDGDITNNLRRLCDIMSLAISAKSKPDNTFDERFVKDNIIEIFSARPKYIGNIKDKSITLSFNVKDKTVILKLVQYLIDSPPIVFSRASTVSDITEKKDTLYCHDYIMGLQEYFNDPYFNNLAKEYYVNKYKEEIE